MNKEILDVKKLLTHNKLLVQSQCEDTFWVKDINSDRKISFHEWTAGYQFGSIGHMYKYLPQLLLGVITPTDDTHEFRLDFGKHRNAGVCELQIFSSGGLLIVVIHAVPQSLGLSSESIETIQTLFNHHTLGGEQNRLMSQDGFGVAFTHALAMSLTPPHRGDDLALHVKYGRITPGIDLSSRCAHTIRLNSIDWW